MYSLYNYFMSVIQITESSSGDFVTFPTLKTGRRSHMAYYQDEKVYLVGGYNGNFLNTIEIMHMNEASGDRRWIQVFRLGNV